MIISHKYKYIFIKTQKTAGTSIEIALSKFSGPDDIVTPISPEDEAIRQGLGYPCPRNYLIPFSRYSKRDFLKALYNRKRLAFRNHSGAALIMNYIDEDVWNSYYKFCFERNPWDKVLSWYYWSCRNEPRPTVSEFVQSRYINNIKGFQLYTVSSDVVVDQVFRYEDIGKAMEEIKERVGLPEVPALPHAKGGFRKDKRSYRDLMTEKDREKIARVYAREIAFFNYEW